MSKYVVTDRGGERIFAGLDVGDIIIHSVGGKIPFETLQSVYDSFPEFKFRKDDILLCAYQKTGTNWMYEILNMICNRSAERVKTRKFVTMLECTPASKLDEVPSPRVLNSHLPVSFLPKDIKVTKPKTIVCVRNPKDLAVSYYNHVRGRNEYEYNGEFSNWLPLHLEGKHEYGKYTNFLKDWEKAINDGIDFPLHLVYYEDLKLNGAKELDRLLKFLEVDLDETLKSDIMKACSFEYMAENKFSKETITTLFKDGFHLFRKGQIGDWKNWLTVAENEMFDSIWESEMKDSKLFKFKYTDPRTNSGN